MTYFILACAWFASTLLFFIIAHKYLIKQYIDEINTLSLQNEQLFEFLTELQNRAAQSYLEIKKVDKRGSFESDDEVGFVFNYLKSNVIDIKNFIDNYLNKD